MTDDEIIKALECCNDGLECCKDCPVKEHNDDCSDALNVGALSLINRQKSEIERLKKIQQTQVDRIIEERGRRYELMSTISVDSIRHGQWLYSYQTTTEVKIYICSECRSERAIDKYDNIEEYKYCPNCGAKMGGEEK